MLNEIVEPSNIAVKSAASVADCVSDADIICTVTAAIEPVLFGRDLPIGVHLNIVGSSVADCAEIDGEAVRKARLFVDYSQMTQTAGGEYIRALADGLIGEGHIIGEVGGVIAGKIIGRRDDKEITLYKSLGIPAEDLFAAVHLFKAAQNNGSGMRVEL